MLVRGVLVSSNMWEAPSGFYTSSSLDLIQALERHQKKEDLEKDLEDILTGVSVYLTEVSTLDLGDNIRVHSLRVDKDVIEVWVEDPEFQMRHYRCTKDKLLGSKDFKEILCRTIKG